MNEFFSSTNNKKIDITLFEPILLFSMFFLPGYMAQGMQEAAPDMFESTFFNFFYIISTIPQILLTLYIIVLKPGRKLSDFNIGRIRLSDIPKSLLTLGGIYLCIIPLGFISFMLIPETDNQLIYGAGWQFSSLRLLPLVLVSCLVTGYCEELFFRSYLFKSLKDSGMKIVTAVIITTLLFGAGHIYEGYFAFAATAVIGAFLSFVFIKTKSIHVIAIGHGLYNFSVLLIAMMGEL